MAARPSFEMPSFPVAQVGPRYEEAAPVITTEATTNGTASVIACSDMESSILVIRHGAWTELTLDRPDRLNALTRR